ncbi:MAG: rod shape-determining protein, partial [Candidatus Liptonbacteria bacterium]|nr:rod shape-determining protein [Candidatus Liptonbacteria bacterium]
VISDFEITQEMLRYFFRRIGRHGSFLHYRRAVIGIPSNLTEVERKSVEDAVIGAGARRAYLIEEPVAAALGAGLPIEQPIASMVIDIGGGTTEIGIISMGGTVMAKSLKIAGDKFNDEIVKFIRDEFKLVIGEPTAEDLKIGVGSAMPIDEKLEMNVRGRDAATGLPREITVRNHHIRLALSRSLASIIEAIQEVIEGAPPELAGDILKEGMHVSGGGSLLRGIHTLIQREIDVPVRIIDDPLTAVARGVGVIIEDFNRYQRVLNNPFQQREINL